MTPGTVPVLGSSLSVALSADHMASPSVEGVLGSQSRRADGGGAVREDSSPGAHGEATNYRRDPERPVDDSLGGAVSIRANGVDRLIATDGHRRGE